MDNSRSIGRNYTMYFNDRDSLRECNYAFLLLGYFPRDLYLKSFTITYVIPNLTDATSLFEFHIAELVNQPLRISMGIEICFDGDDVGAGPTNFQAECVGNSNVEREIANDPKGVCLLEKALALISEKNRETTIGDLLCILAEKQKAGAKWHGLVWCGTKEILYMVIAFTCAAFMDSIVAWFKGWIAKLF